MEDTQEQVPPERAEQDGASGSRQVPVPGGREVRVWDTGEASGDLVVFWHHGTPQTGRVLPPVLEAAAARGIRVVSCARAGYPGTPVLPGRSVADAAADVVAVAAALGIERYATMGASGGGPHALACAALDPDRVFGVVTFAGIAPDWGAGDWLTGMASPNGLATARIGRDARRAHAEIAEFDPSMFIDVDWAALSGTWSSLGDDANLASSLATAGGEPPWGEIDDDVAFTTPWGFEFSAVGCPALVVQGGLDRVIPRPHGEHLVDQLPHAQYWLRPADGHVAVLRALPVALDWLRDLHRD